MASSEETVSIKIQPNVYGSFQILPNKIWYALAEYVDNSLQSHINNKEQLRRINSKYVLKVKIKINKESDSISIEDNAGGISSNNYWRAFEPANIPTDATGLHEHGMGMKTASIWLSDVWSVVTKAVGETEERTTVFDLKKVMAEKKEVLNVTKKSVRKEKHYTHILLKGLSANSPKSQQYGKIKKHLTSIYRKFINSGELKLYFNGELLQYQTLNVLKAPFYKDPNNRNVLWKKDIDFNMGEFSAKGFIGLLETMSTSVDNGISLFRRGRVIVGSHDEKYRPSILSGQPGSPLDKRLFGELELGGFSVSYNKGTFTEQMELEVLMKGIKQELSINGFNLLEQGQHYTKPKSKTDIKTSAKKLINRLKKEKKQPQEIIKPPEKEKLKDESILKEKKTIAESEDYESINIFQTTYKYKVKMVDSNNAPLYSCAKVDDIKNKYDIIINLAHEVFNFSGIQDKTKEKFEHTIVSIIKALAFAELESPNRGTREAGNVRLIFDMLYGKV
jgi:hypothetical protein